MRAHYDTDCCGMFSNPCLTRLIQCTKKHYSGADARLLVQLPPAHLDDTESCNDGRHAGLALQDMYRRRCPHVHPAERGCDGEQHMRARKVAPTLAQRGEHGLEHILDHMQQPAVGCVRRDLRGGQHDALDIRTFIALALGEGAGFSRG